MDRSNTLRARRSVMGAAPKQLLKSPRCKPILAKYVREGGTVGTLQRGLFHLIEGQYSAPMPSPGELAALQAVVKCHEALPSLEKWIGDPDRFKGLMDPLASLAVEARDELDWRPAVEKFHSVRRALAQTAQPIRTLLRRKDIDWSSINRALGIKPSKRVKGHSMKTLVAAVLAEEFRQKFKKPCYREALTLLHDVDPTFPDPDELNYPGDWLYRKLAKAKIPPKVVLDAHARFFPE